MTPVITETSFVSDRSDADRREKILVIQSLNALIENKRFETVVGEFSIGASLSAGTSDIKELFIPCIADSTLDDACIPPRSALRKMVDTEAFAAVCKKMGYPPDMRLCVDQEGSLFALDGTHRTKLSVEGDTSGTLGKELIMLGEYAALVGGYVYSDDQFSVEQWLRHEKFTVPDSVADIKNLIAFLNFELPESPALGDYLELIDAPEDSPFYLSASAQETIEKVTFEITEGKTSLLQKLASRNFDVVSQPNKREHAEHFIERLLKSDRAKALGKACHERLKWHLELDASLVSDRQLQQMAVAAVILDLHARTGNQVLAGYDPYQPDNALLGPAQVREAFELHLIEQKAVEENVAPLAAHLLLAGIAAEFLIADIPAGLTLDKPGWVVITQAVTSIEYAAPGASRRMTYPQIKAFSDLLPVNAAQEELNALTGIIPVVNWAVLNGVIDYRAEKDYDKDALSKATSQFNRYMDALSQSENGLSSTPPDRRKIALEALEKVLPAGNYLEKRSFHYAYKESAIERGWLAALGIGTARGIASEIYDYAVSALGIDEFALSPLLRMRLSILDLYISGDLVQNGQLTDRFKTKGNFTPPPGAFSRLSELRSSDPLYESAFETYYKGVRDGMSSVIKMAVASLPEKDRRTLANCNMTLYTVRKGVNVLNPSQETQAQRDEAKGRYGLILCCQTGNHFCCYELFTLRGLCRERPELATMLIKNGIINDNPTLSYVGGKHDFQAKNHALEWPLDFAAYKSGSEPRTGVTSSVVVEKLWHLDPNASDFRPVSLFFSSQLETLAEFILSHHPVATRQELYDSVNTLTELQRLRIRRDVSQTLLVNVVVPFKKCIEDLHADDAPTVSEGVGGCVLDGLAVIGLLVGLGASVASAVAKTGSTAAKAWRIARIVAHSALSLVNPLDGLPQLGLNALKLAKRGLVWLGRHGASAVQTAIVQIRKLRGGLQSPELIRLLQRSDIQQGTWRGIAGASDAVEIAVIQRQNAWHAVNPTTGGAWGPSLRYLKISNFNPLKKFFRPPKPLSYTKAYLTKAFPHAKSKLDNAIGYLTNIGDDSQIHAVLRHVFGTSSDEAVRHILGNLRAMRSDLDVMSFANISFRKNGKNAYSAMRPETYARWKTGLEKGVPRGQKPERFLVVYEDDLDDLYRMSKYDDGRMGDVLVHELSHGAPGTLDLYYADIIAVKSPPEGANTNLQARGDVAAKYDAAGLLELGKNSARANPDVFLNPHHDLFKLEDYRAFRKLVVPALIEKHHALLNAESYALAVSLLNQKTTAPATLDLNLSAIEKGISKLTDDGFIKGPLFLDLIQPNA